MIKRILALILSLMMVLCAFPIVAMADGEAVIQHTLAGQYDYDLLAVGCTTAFNGNFFSSLFGNNGSDIDVRELIHAYSPVEWVNESGTYMPNKTVVSNMSMADDDNGNRTYRIYLCRDLTYSDGTAITAVDYVFSILLAASKEVAEIGGVNPDLSYIVGMDAYRAGEAAYVSGLRLLSDNVYSVTVQASALPNFYELSMLDFNPCPMYVIAPGCTVCDDGNGAYIKNETSTFSADLLRDTMLNEVNGYVSHPSVVSGPYVLTSFDGVKCSFEINPYFKGDINGRKPTIKKITFQAYTNDTIVEALRTGEIGLINKATNIAVMEAAAELVHGGTYRMSAYPRSGGSLISFSCERVALSRTAVRQAIACCFDKDAAVKAYVGDYGMRVDGYYGIGQWMYSALHDAMVVAAADEGDSDENAVDFAGLGMDDIRVYEQNLKEAKKLLENDGWVLNINGKKFTAGTDAARCKAFDKQELQEAGLYEAALQQGGVEKEIQGETVVLVPLQLTLCYPAGNAIIDSLQETLIQPMAAVGIAVETKAVEYPELLNMYYRRTRRDADMIYLATNFSVNMDLTSVFAPDAVYQNMYNTSGIQDEELYAAARDLIRTEPGDVVTYCAKWLEFQRLYQEKVPGIFVYSNAYIDFYTYALNQYNIAANVTWSHAIVNAYMGDPVNEK